MPSEVAESLTMDCEGDDQGNNGNAHCDRAIDEYRRENEEEAANGRALEILSSRRFGFGF